MILAGARRLASLSPALKDPDDALLPDIAVAPEVNFEVAIAVAEHAIEEGVAEVDFGVDDVRAQVKAREQGVLEKQKKDEEKLEKDALELKKRDKEARANGSVCFKH